jgi:hypothetical protein
MTASGWVKSMTTSVAESVNDLNGFRTQLQFRGLAHHGRHRQSDLARRTQNPDSHGLSAGDGICQTASISFEHEFDFR